MSQARIHLITRGDDCGSNHSANVAIMEAFKRGILRNTSPAYHLLRNWHGLETLPYLGQQLAYIRDDPNLAYI
jgi:hypothetical protein